VSVIAGSAGLVVAVFAEDLLGLWTQDAAVAGTAGPLLSILMLGNMLNSLMWIPYQAQLAHGWTSLAMRVNTVAVLLVIPAILWATPHYGAAGAAWVWVALNTGYFCISVQFMYRRILKTEKWSWYTQDVLAPLLPAAVAVLGLSWLLGPAQDAWAQFGNLVAASCIAVLTAGFCAHRVRAGAMRVLLPFIPFARRGSPKTDAHS
jgi:O-antigen/teichoic acid export membrane protein